MTFNSAFKTIFALLLLIFIAVGLLTLAHSCNPTPPVVTETVIPTIVITVVKPTEVIPTVTKTPTVTSTITPTSTPTKTVEVTPTVVRTLTPTVKSYKWYNCNVDMVVDYPRAKYSPCNR